MGSAYIYFFKKMEHFASFLILENLIKELREKDFLFLKYRIYFWNQFASSLDLYMGYYHIKLYPFSRILCTIVLPWEKYEYQSLPMGLCNSLDLFQEKMNCYLMV